jgi:hypothetical protein
MVFSKMGAPYIFHWDNASPNENIPHKDLEILQYGLETTCAYSCNNAWTTARELLEFGCT